MNKEKLSKYREILVKFREDYQAYVANASHYYGTSNDRLRTPLHEKIPVLTRIVALVHGHGEYQQDKTTYSFYAALTYALDGSAVKADNWPKVAAHVDRIISEAIGHIDNGIFPRKEIRPILPIKDQQLSKRCSDLLSAPGSFDRVINQATQVLEERIRNSVPYEKLCELIPLAKEQIGEPLANRLLSPNNPVIVVSEKLPERVAFHKMVIGIISYLRNPSHHSLNEKTAWSLAWSVVGIIDSLLSELDNSYVSGEKPKTRRQEKKK